jgi:hypothetical protein
MLGTSSKSDATRILTIPSTAHTSVLLVSAALEEQPTVNERQRGA